MRSVVSRASKGHHSFKVIHLYTVYMQTDNRYTYIHTSPNASNQNQVIHLQISKINMIDIVPQSLFWKAYFPCLYSKGNNKRSPSLFGNRKSLSLLNRTSTTNRRLRYRTVTSADGTSSVMQKPSTFQFHQQNTTYISKPLYENSLVERHPIAYFDIKITLKTSYIYR